MEFIKHIKASNILSFGQEGLDLPLGKLNVLIGPNGSGKSNFLELFALLRATPTDLQDVIRKGGGVFEWIWKGSVNAEASLDVIVDKHKPMPIRHHLSFNESGARFHLLDEQIENAAPLGEQLQPFFYYRYYRGNPMINNINGVERRLTRDSVDADSSILSQRRDPDTYPELSYLAEAYEKIRLYREWHFGRDSEYRKPQPSDQRRDRLSEKFENIALIINRIQHNPKAKKELTEHLKYLYNGLTDVVITIVEGGYTQIYFIEGEFSIPATRLSDGSLRYLCLLAILLDPTPPPLICIEEPELGMHPDILPKIADLLIAASERTQIVMTTHSDVLIDALSEHPEAILVCEKHEGSTNIRRLDPETMSHWLQQYRLGQLWSMGEIGGNRW